MTTPLPPNSDEKLWAGLSYAGVAIFAIPTAAIYLLKRGESDYIKFHSLQAIAFFLICLVLGIVFMVLGFIPVIGLLAGLVYFLIALVELGVWIWLMVQAFMGKEPRIPTLAEFLENNFMQ